jgi:hypothetical protein
MGLWAFALLSQMRSSPQKGEGASTGSSWVVGVFASRTGARNVVAVCVLGSSIGKSSVLSSGAPYSGP